MANEIITQTLPTLVSMGVVSRAVDTTMGRRGAVRRGRRASLRGKKVKGRPGPKIHKGSRGGRYIMKKGRRVYI